MIDLYDQIKQRFIKSIVEQLEHFRRDGKLNQLVLVADDKSLGILRENMSGQLRDTVIVEMTAQYAHQTVEKIEKAIVKF